MRGSVPPLPNMLSWHDAQYKKTTGKFYLLPSSHEISGVLCTVPSLLSFRHYRYTNRLFKPAVTSRNMKLIKYLKYLKPAKMVHNYKEFPFYSITDAAPV
jgi:hypothetical protein